MNTEAVYSVSISGDEALVAKVQELLDGLKLSLRDQPIALKRVASEGETPLIRIYIGNNLSCKELREALKVHTVEYGYLINIIPEDETAESRRCTKTALLQAARFYNYYTRESTLANLSSVIVEHDVLNSLYLVTAPEQGAEKQFILKRFLDASVFLDEFSLSFAREGCLKRHTLEESGRNLYEVFPVSFTSVPIPRATFDHLRALNKIQNHLWMKISSDTDFLLEQTKELEKDDEFVGQLTSLLRKVKDSKTAQTATLAITRNDFIADKSRQFLQVEFNMIAAGMGPICDNHAKTMYHMGKALEDAGVDESDFLYADSDEFLAKAMESAWRYYGNQESIIVMICNREKSAYEQFSQSKNLAERGIRLVRYSFEDLVQAADFDEETGIFKIFGREVALFYFREGFIPQHYTDSAWAIREKIELSKSIKCPNVAQQIVNMKYYQYVINQQATWDRFGLGDHFETIRKFFCDLYLFSDFNSEKSDMKNYIENNGGYDSWVLKPQLEGGANNYFGDEIRHVVEESSLEHLQSCVLMRKIDSITRTNIHNKWNRIDVRDSIDEIGVFYFMLVDAAKVISEDHGSAIVRTKITGVNEGGITKNFAVINSLKMI